MECQHPVNKYVTNLSRLITNTMISKMWFCLAAKKYKLILPNTRVKEIPPEQLYEEVKQCQTAINYAINYLNTAWDCEWDVG